jgi:voltage-gated potassium channel Kch
MSSRSGTFSHGLLGLLLLLFAFQPLLTRHALGALLLTAVIGLCVMVQRHRLVAGALAVFAVAFTWWPEAPEIARDAVSAGFLGWTCAWLLADLLRQRRVTGASISAALCAYLLVGLTFAFVYNVLGRAAFIGASSSDPLEFAYFSFVTLTTLGYGDVLPVAPYARSLAVLEAVTGQIVLVVLVARLVGMHVAAHLEDTDG